MFEQLIADAASRFNLSSTSIASLVRELLALIVNGRGSAEGFMEQFNRAGLGDALTSWFGGKEGRTISPAQMESALGASTLERLSTHTGMAQSLVASAAAYVLPRIMGLLTPNGTLPSTSNLLSQISHFMGSPAMAPAASRLDTTPERRSWVPWAVGAVALLALMVWLGGRGSGGTINPQLALSNRDGKITYSGVVRDASARTSILAALASEYGAGNISGNLRVDPQVKNAMWLPRINDLSEAVKPDGAELTINGDNIQLGGWLSAADRQAMIGRLRGSLGAGATIASLADPALEATRAANDKALSALRAIGTSGVSSTDVVNALNLGIINFPTGSAEITSDSQEIIRSSADALTHAPKGTKVEIGGHTDNTGTAETNMTLSQERADAVKRALVSSGVHASMLTAKGYGDTRPRASNETEQGRFQNRRIEYSIIE